MNNDKQYFLHAAGKKIAVGTTRPKYDPVKKGWVTDKGIFSTQNPADYMVTAELAPPPADK